MTKPIVIDKAILNDLAFALEKQPQDRHDIDDLAGHVFSVSAERYLAWFPDESVDMVFTDEPYGVEKSIIAFRGERQPMVQGFEWDRSLPAHIVIPWVYEVARILKPGGVLINCGIQSWSTTFDNICTDAGLDFRANIPWIKTNPPHRIRHGGWRSGYELIWIASKGTLNKRMKRVPQQLLLNWEVQTMCPVCRIEHPVIHSANYDINDMAFTEYVGDWPVMEVAPYVHFSKRIHDTQKPDWMGAKYIHMLTAPGDIVVDPFCGSGVFVSAAATMGRRWSANDRDPSSDVNPAHWADLVREKLRTVQTRFEGRVDEE